jgi:hypothetical protein
MIDPDHFHEGDTPDITQAKRIALTSDILTRYCPFLEDVSNRPIDDPTRLRDFEELLSKMKKEMDQRFATAEEKPVIVPIEINKEGHLVKPRILTPKTFRFHIGFDPSCLGTCANQKCNKNFLKSKKHRKYCSHDCEEQAKRDRFIEKRRRNKMLISSLTTSPPEPSAVPLPPEDPESQAQSP